VIITSRRLAWIRFLEQWLGNNDGQGKKIYRKLLREKGLDYIITQWVEFVEYQFSLDNISSSQHTMWKTSYPIQIQWLIASRKYRGDPKYMNKPKRGK